MINTYQTSMAPPPVPPRLGRPQPFLIPAPLPSSGSNKHLIRFLVCVVTLLLFIAVGGFLFIYYNNNNKNNHKEAERGPSAQAIAGLPPSEELETSSRALARMIAMGNYTRIKEPGYLQWKKTHSTVKKINFYKEHWVTILEPGDYHVFSRVTFSFSKGLMKPLVGRIKLRQSESKEEEDKVKAYCSLNYSASNPQMCTITMEDLLSLKRGNQLSVWVQDLSLVDYDEGATTFGMFQL
ncbi:Tumor necrosis factor ligand superfamily member 6 [Oryzias melastigma]|uniref:Tumor necrosis factor ligand superfamily member 6 n=1 Tax=Oryzias melastigma TaxID=30732 RepID=A0A3B3DP26_ORYME|nr:CD40 ligand [Oryzias melastigma]KAF6732403.1 Tumor necrosis factor ligand superfamily member 6 [Oryzias melastigma]